MKYTKGQLNYKKAKPLNKKKIMNTIANADNKIEIKKITSHHGR